MKEYTIDRPLAFYAPINIHNDTHTHTLIHISHSHIGIRQICRLNHKQYRHTELNNTNEIKINYAMCLFCQVYSKHTQRQLQLRVCVFVCVCACTCPAFVIIVWSQFQFSRHSVRMSSENRAVSCI